MIKKLINVLIFLPIAIVLIVLSVANRGAVTLALNPFDPSDTFLSLKVPLFILIFVAAIFGMFIGSFATWVKQGKHRKKARSQAQQAMKWQGEAKNQKKRADELASQAIVPISSN